MFVGKFVRVRQFRRTIGRGRNRLEEVSSVLKMAIVYEEMSTLAWQS